MSAAQNKNIKKKEKGRFRPVLFALLLALVGGTLTAVAEEVATPQAASAHHYPPIWLGSPVDGEWPDLAGCAGAVWPSRNCSQPNVHHTPYGGDWAVDFQDLRSNTVKHYSSRLSSSAGFTTYAKILNIRNACDSNVRADGGEVVTVGVYRNSTPPLEIGKVFYSHVTPTSTTRSYASSGAKLPTDYGYTIGSVVTSGKWPCWGGKHLHYEVYSNHAYACYWKGFTPNYRVYPSNFLGYMGGNYASAPRKACP